MAGTVEAPPLRPRIKAQVARFLGIARSSEEQLLNALVLVAERHERHYDVQNGATILAEFSRQNLDSLTPLEKRYGSIPSDEPERLRSALLGGTRVGAPGTLQDLQDLSLLAEQCSMAWLMLKQGAKELHDDELLDVASRAKEHTRRQLQWLRTQIEHDAPEPLAVAIDMGGELKTSRPKRITSLSSIPDTIWAPGAAAVLLLLVGLAGLLVGRPWLLPSLGPTAVLQAENPAHPTSRAWNVLMGHIGGLVAGFAGVFLFQASDAPAVLVSKELAPERVGAAAVAVLLTVLLGIFLRASHPPAAATTLLVALGAIATLEDAANLLAGVVILTVAGELLRRVRLERVAPAERMAPAQSQARFALRR